MSGPIGAGAGAPAPTGLREPTIQESYEMSEILYPASDPSRVNTKALLVWLKAHPDIRLDAPFGVGTVGEGEWWHTPIGGLLGSASVDATDPVVAEALTRVPNIAKPMGSKQMRLAQFVKIYGERSKKKHLPAKIDMIRKKIEQTVKPIGEVRMADSLARQKNLPDEVGELIASKLSGTTGTIQEQQATLKKSAGMSGGRRKRKTRRNTSRKQGARR